MNRQLGGLAALTLVALTLVSATAGAQETDPGSLSLTEAIGNGKFGLGFRYRYEYVNDDNPVLFDDTAHASTVRLRMNYRTGTWRHFSAFGEFDYVGEVLLDDFNNLSGDPGRGDYPVVADPKGPDLNQLYLDYSASDNARLRFGRQRILLDNQRFVGGVGWRQNEQTYDGMSLSVKELGNAELQYAYVTTVRRIPGNEVAAGRHDVAAHLLNVNFKVNDNWSVVPYYYYIDNEDAAGASTGTFGVRATGKVPVGESNLSVVAEYASQSDVANNPVSYDADYLNLSASYAWDNGLSLALAYESLGGDQNRAGSAFRTPLATLHAFQGWADKFLATPGAGVEDLFVTAKYKAGDWNLTGVYHDFSAEDGSADWGSEFDFSAGRSLGNGYGLLLKAAMYDADQHSADTTKFWVMITGTY